MPMIAITVRSSINVKAPVRLKELIKGDFIENLSWLSFWFGWKKGKTCGQPQDRLTRGIFPAPWQRRAPRSAAEIFLAHGKNSRDQLKGYGKTLLKESSKPQLRSEERRVGKESQARGA